MSTHPFTAPAKLNLSLRVIRKREDGFHDIDTLMLKLPGLADTLIFEETGAYSLTCDTPDIPTDDSNLVTKAARAFAQAAATTLRHSITLDKAIPSGAGLGGGSSDAATTLTALNQLHDSPLDPAELHEIAATLGSDIPFFLRAEPAARCTGRGEVITAATAPAPLPVLLLKPSFGVATPDAYQRWQTSREIPGIHYAASNIDGLEIVNDLERPVFQKHRFLAELKQWLADRSETRAALLSGSGSTVFAILRDDADATHLANCARHELDPHLWHWSGTTA